MSTPFGGDGSTMFQFWTPTQLGNASGPVMEFGFQMATPVNGTWPRIVITIGETSRSNRTISASYANNFDISTSPPVVVYDGSATITTTTNNAFFRLPLMAPFHYSGTNSLAVLFTVAGETTSLTGIPNLRIRSLQAAPSTNAISFSHASLNSGEIWNRRMPGASFLFGASAPSGAAVSVVDVRTTLGSGPIAGSNVLRVKLKNSGSTDLSNQPLVIEYSTDGGFSWPPTSSQQVTVGSFGLGQQATVDLTAVPWVLSGPSVEWVKVRVQQATQHALASRLQIFTPDADVVAVGTGLSEPSLGANTVTVAVRNCGRFNLNGQMLSLQYSTDQGATWVGQDFMATALGDDGDEQRFTFNNAWMRQVPDKAYLWARIAVPVPGDPDLEDLIKQTYEAVGSAGLLVTHAAGGSVSNFPWQTSNSNEKLQTYYTPEQLGHTLGTISHVGFQMVYATSGTWANVRIELGEIDLSALPGGTLGANFAANYNVVGSGPVTCLNATNVTFPTTSSGQYGMFQLTTPFEYSGLRPLLVTWYIAGRSGGVGGDVRANTNAPNNRVYTQNLGDAATGTVNEAYGYNMRFQFAARHPGLAVSVAAAGVGGGDLTVTGNTVVASVKNDGSVAWGGMPWDLQYSTDGGITYSAPQTFQMLVLQPGDSQQVSFTTPWTPMQPGVHRLVVRAVSPVGGGRSLAAHTYRPDADVEAVETVPGMPVIGANTVRVSVRNNGNFDLAGVQLPLTYMVTGAAVPVGQVFTETASWPNGALRVFDFNLPWHVVAVAPAVLQANISPTLPGDPDSADTASASWIDAGATGDPVVYVPGTVPFVLSILGASPETKKLQYWCSPSSVGGWGTITQFGIPFSEATHLALTRIRIELGEVDLGAHPSGQLTGWFARNYNVPGAGPVVAYDGPATIQTGSPLEPWRLVLQTPFYYSGDHPLLVTLLLSGVNHTKNSGGGKVVTLASPAASFLNTSNDAHSSSVGTGLQHGAFLRVTQHAGTALRLSTVRLAAGRPALGNNVVQAEVKNIGSDPISSVTLEYSTDGGATFPANQSETFNLAPLPPISGTLLSFTTPWAISAVERTTLVVRVSPQIGAFPAERSVTFVPDLDIDLLETTPAAPSLGSHTVKVTVRNSGDFNMSGVPVNLRYSGDRGATYATAVVAPSSMATVGSTFVHTFTTPWVIAAPGDYELRAEIHPAQAGDPDGSDVVIHNFSGIGVPPSSVGTVTDYTATTGPSNYSNSIPFVPADSRKLQTAWTPAQLSITSAATITEIGFRAISNAFGGTWPVVRVYLGETTKTGGTSFSTNYDANYDVAAKPKTKVFDGPMTVALTTAGSFWRVPIDSYAYSGANNLLITVYVESSNTSTSIVGGTIHAREGGPCAIIYSAGQGDAITGTLQSGMTLSVSTRAILPHSGQALTVTAAAVVGGMAAIGPNAVSATVSNTGTSDLSNVPFFLDYSVDGGLSFSSATSQGFVVPSLGPSQSAAVTFSALWTISQMKTHHLVVRVNPAIGPGPVALSRFVRPDADLSDVRVASSNALIGDNQVQVTVTNTGGVSLNGHPLTLMYRVTSPSGEIASGTGQFVPTALATLESSETFAFAQPWQLSSFADATLTASIVSAIQGDPDASDTVVRHYPLAGRVDLEVGFDPLVEADAPSLRNSGGTDMHFGYGSSNKIQSNVTPEQLSYASGYITRFGIQLAEANGPFTLTNLRVEFGGSTIVPASATTTFDLNYNVPAAPKQVVFNGPFSMNFTEPDQMWYIDLTTPYHYTGEHNLLVTTFATGSIPFSAALDTRILSGAGVTENFTIRSQGNGDAPSGSLQTNLACGVRFVIESVTAFPSIDVRSVGVLVGSLPIVGTNTVVFSAKNRSATNLSNHTFTAEYSSDGGQTWPSSQQQVFTPATWPSANTLNFQFTTPWTLAAADSGKLVVRLIPQVGAGNPEVALPFSPDLDVVQLDTVPALPVPGQPASIRATVKNNGTLSLNGLQATLRYTVNAGLSWTQEVFTLSGLDGAGTTQTLQFTQLWTPAVGNHHVMVEVVAPFSGDPDAWDGRVAVYTGLGSSTVEIPDTGTIVVGPEGLSNPFASQKAQRRLESLYLPAELASAGLVAGSWIHGVQWKTTILPFYDHQNFRIRLESSALQSLPFYTAPGAVFQTNTPLIQYGPAVVPLSSLQVGEWFGFDFTRGHTWDGTAGLLVDVSCDNQLQTTNFGNVVWRETPVNRSNLASYSAGVQVFPFTTQPHQSFSAVPSIRIRHGFAVLADQVSATANHTIANGAKEIYLGESIPVSVTLSNPTGTAMEVGSLFLRAVFANDGSPCHAISAAQLAAPVAIAANSTATASLQISVAGSWTGMSGPVLLTVAGGLATIPSQPTTPAFLAVTAAAESLVFMPFLPPPPVQIVTASLLPAQVNANYNATIAPAGGSGAYAISVSPTSASALPAGLSLSAWATSGAPAHLSGRAQHGTSGTYNVTFQCIDGVYLVRKTLALSVVPGPIQVSSTSLPPATESSPYLAVLEATGGDGPLVWSVSPASAAPLPSGLFLAPSGLLGGVPSALTQGTHVVTFRCSDGSAHSDVLRPITVNPTSVLGYVGPAAISGRVAVSFHQMLLANGGLGNRQFALNPSSPLLPDGLALVGSTGVIYGTPTATAAGTHNLLITLSDGVTSTVFGLTITILLPESLEIETTALPDAQIGSPWSLGLQGLGGTEVYTWSMSVMPSTLQNLTLNPNTGQLSLTPGPFDAGRYTVTLTLSDGSAAPVVKSLPFAVMKPGTFGIKLTEIAIGSSKHFEISNVGSVRTDLSGWTFDVWVNSTTPLVLDRRSFPLGTQLLPGSVLPVTFGTPPAAPIPGQFHAGGPQTAFAPSGTAFAVWDAAGNLVDFVAAGTIQSAALQSATNGLAPIRPIDWGFNAQGAFAGLVRHHAVDTNQGSDWAAISLSPGLWNPGLTRPSVQVIPARLSASRVAEPYSATVIAAAGIPPYTFGISAPGATWLTINAATGELTGTPPASSPPIVSLLVTVTDSQSGSAAATLSLAVLGAAEPVSGSLLVSAAEGSALRDSSAAISITFTGQNLPQEFEFLLELGTAEAVLDAVAPGPGVSGLLIDVWKTEPNRYRIVGSWPEGAPLSPPSGSLLDIVLRTVPVSGELAAAGTFPVAITGAIGTAAFEAPFPLSGVAGSLSLSWYLPTDVNRDGSVDVVDVQTTVNLILALLASQYSGQGDANGDEVVDVVDIQTIVNCILAIGACD